MDETNDNIFDPTDRDDEHAFSFISVRASWLDRLRFITYTMWRMLGLLNPATDGGFIVAKATPNTKPAP